MADPFSIVSAAAGLADIVVRLTKYIRQIQKAIGTIEADINDLVNELESLNSVCQLLESRFVAVEPTVDVTQALGRTLENCKHVVAKLESLIEEIYGKWDGSTTGFRDKVAKAMRNNSRQTALNSYRSQITLWQSSIQLLLMIGESRDFDQLSNWIKNIDQSLQKVFASNQSPNEVSVF
ncbi:putative tetratricopeptide repeat domain-containing protein [Diaporthe ampelina]|uniref:Putative tetratricopeptide repeat domain-containing protein n=1 Tax=Diaporthe ampelina TaxID=1214573 RepID=A0A0G2FF21_9PEZI|nr:putative tetratricopeptide repeat domain-containing protein [Diaporthe ampelina]